MPMQLNFTGFGVLLRNQQLSIVMNAIAFTRKDCDNHCFFMQWGNFLSLPELKSPYTSFLKLLTYNVFPDMSYQTTSL